MTSIHTLYSDDTALPSADLPYLLRCVDAALGCLFSSKSAVGSNLTGLVSCKALSFTGVLVCHCKMLYICSKMHDPAPPLHHHHHNWEHSINGATHLFLEHLKRDFLFSKVKCTPPPKNAFKHKIFTSHQTAWVEIVSLFSNSVTLWLYFLSCRSLCL